MLYKKFGKETFANVPAQKFYKTEESDEVLCIDKKYNVLKQGKSILKFKVSLVLKYL